jgi:hypothetical protein
MSKTKNKTAEAASPPVDADDQQPADDVEVEPEPERPIAEAPSADMDAEFPTPWHRESYLANLEREIEGAKLRVEELTEFGVTDDVLAAANEMVENAAAELARVKKAK